MNSATLKSYLGVPVLVQLNSLICGIVVLQQQSLPYAAEQKKQWMPEPIPEQGPGSPPAVSQVIQFGVLREIEGSDTHVELLWLAPTANKGSPATISTLLPKSEIGYVTRVVAVPDEKTPGKILLA